jgi:hypothetical protein
MQKARTQKKTWRNIDCAHQQSPILPNSLLKLSQWLQELQAELSALLWRNWLNQSSSDEPSLLQQALSELVPLLHHELPFLPLFSRFAA